MCVAACGLCGVVARCSSTEAITDTHSEVGFEIVEPFISLLQDGARSLPLCSGFAFWIVGVVLQLPSSPPAAHTLRSGLLETSEQIISY